MTFTQTVDIPPDRRLTIDVPREVPTGRTSVVIQFPVLNETQPTVKTEETTYSILSKEDAVSIAAEVIEKYRPAFEALAK